MIAAATRAAGRRLRCRQRRLLRGTLLVGRVTRLRYGPGRVIIARRRSRCCWGYLPLAMGPLWLIVAFLVAQQLSDGVATIGIVDQSSLLRRSRRDPGRVHGAIRVISGVAV